MEVHYMCLKLLIFTLVVTLGTWNCLSLDNISLSKYETGKSKFQELEMYAANKNYGKCWTNAIEVIKVGCHEFSEETHARMALAYLNCFLEMQGRQGYICSESDAVQTCTKLLSDSDRSTYATFFTHTHSICYFLQSQVWHEKTQKTIHRLSVSSEEVADQLEESSKLQKQVLESQNQSLKNQELILDKARNLSKIINSSAEDIHEMLSDFQKTAVKQQNLINNLFDRVAQIQTLVTGEMSTIYSLVYYIVVIFISYLLTSAKRTNGARLWLFGTIIMSMGTEWMLVFYVFKSGDNPDTFKEQADLEISHYHIIWYWREFIALLAVCILVYKAYRYKDIHELNHQYLQDLRTDVSYLRKDVKELVDKTSQKQTDTHEQNVSTESKVLVSSTPTQETGSPVQIENPAESGSHIEPIPVEHLPDTPVSQKSKLSHDLDSLSSESSKSKPRRSRSKRSKERELNALRASSPNESKRDLLASWTMSGYYSSPYTAIAEDGGVHNIHEDPTSPKGIDDQNIADDSTDISLSSTKRYNLRLRARTRTKTS